jgi:uncharacterized membrane protein YhaH (DUF805 family)
VYEPGSIGKKFVVDVGGSGNVRSTLPIIISVKVYVVVAFVKATCVLVKRLQETSAQRIMETIRARITMSTIKILAVVLEPVKKTNQSRFLRFAVLACVLVVLLAACQPAIGTGGPWATWLYVATGTGLSISSNNGASWMNFLGSNAVNRVYVANAVPSICAATNTGLSVSSDGATWTTYTSTTTGFGGNVVDGVFMVSPASSLSIYAATNAGLSVSVNGGATWNTYPLGNVNGVWVDSLAGTIYAATGAGLLVSTDGGATWPSNYTSATSGFGTSSVVSAVYVVGSGSAASIYAGTNGGGVSISNNGGSSWTNYPYTGTTSGPASNIVQDIFVSGGTIYAATDSGLSFSTDSGTSWTTYTTASTGSMLSNNVRGVFVSGTSIYAATAAGLSISTNSGTSWTTITKSQGLAGNDVRGVFFY